MLHIERGMNHIGILQQNYDGFHEGFSLKFAIHMTVKVRKSK